VAEGIPTTRSAWELAQRLNVPTPIIEQVYAVLYEQRQPTIAVEKLLRREQKPE
jgi:glycerol-3-phosphate dehydrogenase (NAD(P)+)